MIDINRHRFYLFQILKDIYSDLGLLNTMVFKGGTALMFFYDLPRFSVDLNFNLLQEEKEAFVYRKVRAILLKYGTITDEAKKHFGTLFVLDYGVDERNLKVEISKRIFDNRYEIKNLLGINTMVMVQEDMFAHKLCALLDRKTMANRDIFDCWFFMKRQTPVNKQIIESRMNMLLSNYLQTCIEYLEAKSDRGILDGIGELVDEQMKRFVKTKMRAEVIRCLRFYKDYPILSKD